ncbi:MAG: hypothetical protein WD470_11190 [Rhodospirillaceae bacterium]
MRTWIVRALAAAGIVAASGCAMLDELDRASARDEGVAAVPAAWPDSGFDPLPGETDAPREPPISAESVPIPKRKPLLIDPKSLVGLDQSAVFLLFGQPHQVTQAQPATVWVWEMNGCRMRLFFYPDVTANISRALTYEVSADSQKSNSLLTDVCPSRIKWAHAEASR